MSDLPVGIVTGASRGIGLAITRKLLELGYRVVMTARDRLRLEAAAADLVATCDAADRLVTCSADVADEAALRALVSEAMGTWGRIDVLVNNAGIGVFGHVETLSASDWDQVMAVNVRAPFILSREVIPHLALRDRAWIINIASVVAHKGYEKQALYGASKHALLGMSKALAKELQAQGTRVHVISPGGVDTDMVADARPDLDPSTLIRPNDVADAVGYLLCLPPSASVDEINIRRDGASPWA